MRKEYKGTFRRGTRSELNEELHAMQSAFDEFMAVMKTRVERIHKLYPAEWIDNGEEEEYEGYRNPHLFTPPGPAEYALWITKDAANTPFSAYVEKIDGEEIVLWINMTPGKASAEPRTFQRGEVFWRHIPGSELEDEDEYYWYGDE